MESNFRITTDYIFELYDTNTGEFYKCWIEGEDGAAAIKIASVPDTAGVAIEITAKYIPDGNKNSNYRIISSVLQIYNVDTQKYHTIFVTGNEKRTAFSISPNGYN